MSQPKLTIFFPAWNEEEYVERAVSRAHAVLTKLSRDFEILIVDDASTDRTREVTLALQERYPQLRIVTHPENRKLGGAMKTGFKEARGEVVIYSDIDLPFDLAEVEKALRLLDYLEADMICGFRHDRTSEGPKRIVYSFGYNWLIRALFGVFVKDINFSFKVVRRRVLQAIELKSEGSFIDAELVVKATKLGFKVFQIGVDYFPRTRGVSTLASPMVIAKIIRELGVLYPEIKNVRPLPVAPVVTLPVGEAKRQAGGAGRG